MSMEYQEYTVDLTRNPDGRTTVAATRTFSIELGSESDARINSVFRIAERNSTVLSTLKTAVQVTGEWQRS